MFNLQPPRHISTLPGGLFHGHGPYRSALPGVGAGARHWRQRDFRAGRPHRLAHPSARTDADRHRRDGTGAALGRSGRGNLGGRCGLVSARREALARRFTDDGNDAHRHPGTSGWQGGRLAGARDRRPIPRVSPRLGETEAVTNIDSGLSATQLGARISAPSAPCRRWSISGKLSGRRRRRRERFLESR